MALIGNARQATSGGKSGPVETGLTGLAVTALLSTGVGFRPLTDCICVIQVQKLLSAESQAGCSYQTPLLD